MLFRSATSAILTNTAEKLIMQAPSSIVAMAVRRVKEESIGLCLQKVAAARGQGPCAANGKKPKACAIAETIMEFAFFRIS